MKILLTGCAGFIGSHTLDRLLADGHTVIGVDNFDPFYDRALKNANIANHVGEGLPLDQSNTDEKKLTSDLCPPASEKGTFELLEADLADPETYTKIKFLADGLGQKAEDGSQKTEDRGQKTEDRLVSEDLSSGRCPPASESGTAGFDAIIHLAAKAGVRPSIEDPAGYQRANVIATQNLLEFAREQSIRQFVFAGSSSVYGVNPNVPWSEDDAVLRPISPYASTKVSGELLGHVYSHLYGIRFLSLRFFTVYGPRQRPDLAIHKFTRMILDGQPIPVFGDGSTRRDYTFVADIIDGIHAALHYDKSSYEVINLGNDQTVTLSEMIATIETALGKKAIIDRQPDQPGDVPQTWANVKKGKQLLGYEPKTSFKVGVERFIQYIICNN